MQLPLYLFDPSRSAPGGCGEDVRQTTRDLLFPLAPGFEIRVLAGLPLVGTAAGKRDLLAERTAAGRARLLLSRQVGTIGTLPGAGVVRLRTAQPALRIRARTEGNGVELAGNPGNKTGVNGRGGPLRAAAGLRAGHVSTISRRGRRRVPGFRSRSLAAAAKPAQQRPEHVAQLRDPEQPEQ